MMALRQLFEVELDPRPSSRFQPTGFPDLGPAEFSRPRRAEDGTVDWVDCVEVESFQSMANHLEAVGWDDAQGCPADALADLPYVRVVAANDGRFLTSSRLESHRLASAWIKDSTYEQQQMDQLIKERFVLQDDTPLDRRQIARALLQMDPLCLIHGVFFADKVWPGQPRIARAVTALIEAEDVRPAHSGGVKREQVRHSLGDQTAGGTSEGYGSVPFHRTLYTAASITLRASLDLDQIESYGLSPEATSLLLAIARWELSALLHSGLRLRSQCDLAPRSSDIADVGGSPLGSPDELAAEIKQLATACPEYAEVEPRVMTVQWAKATSRKKGS